MLNMTYPFENPPLPYGYTELEPYIDETTMKLHHGRHLQTYIDNLNFTLADYPQFHHWTLEELLYNIDSLPEEIRTSVKNNGGGVYNHIFYFESLLPRAHMKPQGTLGEKIRQQYGSVDNFINQYAKAVSEVFGSGYVWLVLNKDRELEIIKTANQDTPLPLNLCPILNTDIWEHAYYLKHYNMRIGYLQDFFSIANWQKAEERYKACTNNWIDKKTSL